MPRLLAALAAAGLEPGAVDYLFLTHIHLDHAGGAGALLQHLPQARVVVHPRGARHLARPAQLILAARVVYGDAAFDAQYGRIEPVPEERLLAAEEGAVHRVGRRRFEFLHTPGHALHHLVAFDRDSGELFAGDTFGVSYRELDTAAGEFGFATTSPSQFDPEQLHASVERIVRMRPQAVYVTHYGRVREIERLGAALHADIDAFVRIAQDAGAPAGRAARIQPPLFEYLSRRLDAHGYGGDEALRHALLDLDVELNAAGLDAWLTRCAS